MCEHSLVLDSWRPFYLANLCPSSPILTTATLYAQGHRDARPAYLPSRSPPCRHLSPLCCPHPTTTPLPQRKATPFDLLSAHYPARAFTRNLGPQSKQASGDDVEFVHFLPWKTKKEGKKRSVVSKSGPPTSHSKATTWLNCLTCFLLVHQCAFPLAWGLDWSCRIFSPFCLLYESRLLSFFQR